MKTSTTRILSIEDFNPAGRLVRKSSASLIRLKGGWLKQAGFPAGAQVVVNNPSPGIIELRVSASVQNDASYFAALQQRNAVLNENSPTPGITRPL